MVEKLGLDLMGIGESVQVLKQNVIKKAVCYKVTPMAVQMVNQSRREWDYFHKIMESHVSIDCWQSNGEEEKNFKVISKEGKTGLGNGQTLGGEVQKEPQDDIQV